MIRPFALLVGLVLFLATDRSSLADEAPLVVPEGRIIGKVWHTKVQFDTGMEYVQKVREELEIPESPILMVMQPAGVNFGPGHSGRGDAAVELKGTLFFLQTKPTISLSDQIAFELLGTDPDFQAFVKRQKDMMGPAAELIGDGDRYEVKLDFAKLMAGGPGVPQETSQGEPGDAPAGDAPVRKQSVAIMITANAGSGEPLKPGEAPQMPKSMSTYYRFVDGIMYSSRNAALHHIDLPTQASLKLTDEEAANDLFADFDFREIPADLKRVFWTAVESQASVFLQRFDDEAAGDYSLRRAIAEGRLELLKSVLFDVDRAWFTLNLSPDDVQPIVAKLRVQARENSPLAFALDSLGNARSQLGVLQDEESPLVVSGTLAVPETLRPFSEAFVASLALKMKDIVAATPGADVLVDDLMKPLQQSATVGVLDAAICLRGSVATGLIPCGGMKIENAEQFLGALETLVQIADADRRLIVTHSTIGGYRMVSIRREAATLPATEQPMAIQLNLAATGSWLWFTVGGEPAIESLEELVSHHDDSTARTGESVPLLVRFQLNKWLGESDDALSKLPERMLTELERWIGRRTTPKMSIRINGADAQQSAEPEAAEFTSYAAKVFKPENSELEIKVRTASRELVVDASVGTALVKFGIAQFLDAQSRMFKGMNLQFGPAGAPGDGNVRKSQSIEFRVGGPGKQ